VSVLAVAEAHESYANEVAAVLRAAGVRVEVDAADEKLGNRIRKAKTQKIPYVLVVGDDDVAHGTVGVNPRGGDVDRGVAVATFVESVVAEIAARS